MCRSPFCGYVSNSVRIVFLKFMLYRWRDFVLIAPRVISLVVTLSVTLSS